MQACGLVDRTDTIGSIATFGILAALLGIAFDPFGQQLVLTTAVVHYADDLGAQFPFPPAS